MEKINPIQELLKLSKESNEWVLIGPDMKVWRGNVETLLMVLSKHQLMTNTTVGSAHD